MPSGQQCWESGRKGPAQRVLGDHTYSQWGPGPQGTFRVSCPHPPPQPALWPQAWASPADPLACPVLRAEKGRDSPCPWELVGKGGGNTWPSGLCPVLTARAQAGHIPSPRAARSRLGTHSPLLEVGEGLSAEGQAHPGHRALATPTLTRRRAGGRAPPRLPGPWLRGWGGATPLAGFSLPTAEQSC